MAGEHKYLQAMALVRDGLSAQESGDLDRAIQLYSESLTLCPTAEGHTFLGWALSYQGDLEQAIEHCRDAIALDPEFGNPYNDIGVYLMQRDQFDEAIPWLEQAKAARRYEPRHFPYLNLGRIYMVRGELLRAVKEFEGALQIAPDDDGIRQIIAGLRAKLN
ncbi:MAG TPA: tetratricopeptide repeat protein [Candidatus Binataceae bacterium]|nr:tetratricopeptide repeat protein [Candidatus Binataceae bacterium]